jgi:hypothetical protein
LQLARRRGIRPAKGAASPGAEPNLPNDRSAPYLPGMIITTMNDLPGYIIAFRFDTSELGSTWTEICAYGTAVRARQS